MDRFNLVGRINWKTLLPLKLVLDNIASDDFAAPLCCDESDFIEAALRAAKNSNSNARASILSDVCLMLNCKPEDLGFLFQANLDKNLPQIFKLDLPDYRLRTSEVYLEAAE